MNFVGANGGNDKRTGTFQHLHREVSRNSTTKNYDVPIAEFKPFHSSCLTMSHLTWIVEMDTDNPITVQTWLHRQLSHT